jgi:hypothetical protein
MIWSDGMTQRTEMCKYYDMAVNFKICDTVSHQLNLTNNEGFLLLDKLASALANLVMCCIPSSVSPK